MSLWRNLQGLIPILAGIFCILVAKGIFPRNPKDPEKLALWRRKFGPWVIILGPLVILFGLLQLLGLL
jgi:hypothetical protein